MFDLNEQIKNWRSQLEASEAYQKADVEELESHLFEEIDQLKKKDLNEEEAFWIAAHRIGKLKSLNQEFFKVNQKSIWLKRMTYILGGYLLFNLTLNLTNILSFLLYTISDGGFIKLGFLGTPSIPIDIIIITIVTLLFFLYLIFPRKKPIINKRRMFVEYLSQIRRIYITVFVIATLFFINFGRPAYLVLIRKYVDVSTYGKLAYANSMNFFALTFFISILFFILFINSNSKSKSQLI